jgi:hypothetical protein
MGFSENPTMSVKSTEAISRAGWGDEEVMIATMVSSPNSITFR